MATLRDLTGQRFGKLTVIARGQNTKSGKATWVCTCDCGKRKEKSVVAYDLISGKVRSCGCIYFESNKGRRMTHGKTSTRLHRIWCGMRQRCNDPAYPAYRIYGGKGVTVCEEWSDFQSFYDWSMENGYREDLTIDRIDSNGNYCPENCRWATMKEQQNNRTNNIRLSVFGIEKTISEWSEASGIPRATLDWRVKNHWAEDELFMPVNLSNSKIRREKNSYA